MKPIIFRPELSVTIGDGRKTVTRRLKAPTYERGTLLYVRETFWHCAEFKEGPGPDRANPQVPAWVFGEEPKDFFYIDELPANHKPIDIPGFRWKKRPGIHMPRFCSRLHLRVVSIHEERLSGATEWDARAEGFETLSEFRAKWDEINPDAPWISNPNVHVIEFETAWKSSRFSKEAA